MNLTAQRIATLKLDSGVTDRIIFDDIVPGFGLRLRQSGASAWVFQYKLGRKTRRLTFGSAAAIKVARAREIASELHARVRLGGDPAGERRIKIERASHTFAALVARYVEQQRGRLRPSSLREMRRHLEKHAAPLHALPVDAIDRRIISERLNAVAKTSGDVAANRAQASVSAMFAWGIREGLVSTNPVIGTNRREERSRDRVLKDAELKLIWRALDRNQYGTIIELLMLTAQRVNEIAGLRWSEVDFDRDLISLPAERTKNRRPHDIPTASKARELLLAQPRTEGRDLIFGKGAGPFSCFSKFKAALDKSITRLNGGKALAPWVLHDLRRSAATGMAELGIQPHVIEAVLNHVSGHKGGIAGIYNRAAYSAEKAAALARWDEHVTSVVGGPR
jgi:integrase